MIKKEDTKIKKEDIKIKKEDIKIKKENIKMIKIKEESTLVMKTPTSSSSSSELMTPNLCRPTIHETFLAIKLLSDLHGIPERLSTSQTVLDSLVRTILSQNTTDKNSRVAFNKLKSEYPTWKSVLKASDSDIIECIRFGGLAETKTKRIKEILITILKDHPNECKDDISLDFLKNMSTEDIKDKLSKFKGVGPKTISCVLMFCLQRDDFPVGIYIYISKLH